MRKLTEYSLVAVVGAVGYSLIELAWRGHTHWTMSLTGGGCFLVLYLLERYASALPRWGRCLLGSLIITAVELGVGAIVNLVLGWGVWDYSELPLNFAGQICLLYTLLWYWLCLPSGLLCDGIMRGFRALSERRA